jgi:hypothetical protein
MNEKRIKFLKNKLDNSCISESEFYNYLMMKKIDSFVCELNREHCKKIDFEFFIEYYLKTQKEKNNSIIPNISHEIKTEKVKKVKKNKKHKKHKRCNESSSSSSITKYDTTKNSTTKHDITKDSSIERKNIYDDERIYIKPHCGKFHMFACFVKNENGIVLQNVQSKDEYRLYQKENTEIINKIISCDFRNKYFYVTFDKINQTENNICFINITGLIETPLCYSYGSSKHIKNGMFYFESKNKNKYWCEDDYQLKQHCDKYYGIYYLRFDRLNKKYKYGKKYKQIHIIEIVNL